MKRVFNGCAVLRPAQFGRGGEEIALRMDDGETVGLSGSRLGEPFARATLEHLANQQITVEGELVQARFATFIRVDNISDIKPLAPKP